MDSIAGPFHIDWRSEDLEKVKDTVVKKFNAELHSQSALEGILEIMQEHPFPAEQVEKVEVDIFDVAYKIIGGGEEGEKTTVRTKEEADHSLPYMLAVAMLDGQVMPAQYLPERINRPDVQALLRKIQIRPSEEFSQRFPAEFPCRITVTLMDNLVLTREKVDYEGFRTRPASWELAITKFNLLSSPYALDSLRNEIIATVETLDEHPIDDLIRPLSKVQHSLMKGVERVS